LLVLLVIATAAACARDSGSVRIGAAAPWHEPYGRMSRRGIALAVDEINRAGGVLGDSLRVEFENDSADGARAASIARRFVDDPQIVGVVGHANSGTMVAAARVYDAGLPAIATTATTPDLTGISPWVFRMITSDSVNGAAMARFAIRLGRKRAAILYVNDAWGRGLTEAFRRSFDSLGGTIVSEDPIEDRPDQDFEPYIATFRRSAPDIVFVPTTEAAGIALLREARRQGLQADFLGGDGWTGIVADPASAEGAYVGAPFSASDPRPEAQTFVRAFRERFGEAPDGNAVLAYDATKLLARAIAQAGPDRVRVREWLATISEGSAPRGAAGKIRFGPDGDPAYNGFVMTRVRDGALVIAGGER
jgi:branched-chain amino acid transport system substrate-binding protein